MHVRHLLLSGLVLLLGGCGHASRGPRVEPSSVRLPAPDPGLEEGVRSKGDSTINAHIRALIVRGEFTQAEAYIAEAEAASLLSRSQAAQWLDKIAKLNTKLREIPASVQRAKDFPSQLKEYTLHQIEQMLKNDDFSIATAAQLRQAAKLIKEHPRILPKAQ